MLVYWSQLPLKETGDHKFEVFTCIVTQVSFYWITMKMRSRENRKMIRRIHSLFLRGQSSKLRENIFQYRIKHILIPTSWKRHSSSPTENCFPTVWHASVVSKRNIHCQYIFHSKNNKKPAVFSWIVLNLAYMYSYFLPSSTNQVTNCI